MAGPTRWMGYLSGLKPSWLRSAAAPEEPSNSMTLYPSDTVPTESPASTGMTVAEYVERKFLPEHIARKRTPGRRHYQAILKHILNPDYVDQMFGVVALRSKPKLKTNPDWPYLDHIPLRDIQPHDVQRLITVAIDSGYSTQTAKHIRNVVSAIISHAIREGHFIGGNPAILVSPPGMRRKTPHALTFEQTIRVLQGMRYPEWDMTLMVILTRMNVAEICGLQWRYVNLSDQEAVREGERIPAHSLVVSKQWYRGELSAVPEGRRKIVPIPPLLRSVLLRLRASRNSGATEFVLVSRAGKPVNQINVAARRLKSIGEQLGMPWLSWQVFRRTRSQLVHEFGAQLQHELAVSVTLRPDLPPIPIDHGRRR